MQLVQAKEEDLHKIYTSTKSYGVILIHIPENINECKKYLIYKRRDTIEYISILRGFYKQYKLKEYVKRLSKDEMHRILNYTFDVLWEDLWINKTSIYKTKERSKRKYSKNLQNIILWIKEINPDNITKPFYFFPKGKKDPGETEVDAAIREFQEESRISLNKECNIVKDLEFIESFTGSDGNNYSVKYFLFTTNKLFNIEPKKEKHDIRNYNYLISEEASKIKWVTIKNAENKLNNFRYNLLKYIDSNYNNLVEC